MRWLLPCNGINWPKRRKLRPKPKWSAGGGGVLHSRKVRGREVVSSEGGSCLLLSFSLFSFNNIVHLRSLESVCFLKQNPVIRSPEANLLTEVSCLWLSRFAHTDITDIGMNLTIPCVWAVHRLKPKLFLVPITDVSLCSIFNSDIGTGCPGDTNLGKPWREVLWGRANFVSLWSCLPTASILTFSLPSPNHRDPGEHTPLGKWWADGQHGKDSLLCGWAVVLTSHLLNRARSGLWLGHISVSTLRPQSQSFITPAPHCSCPRNDVLDSCLLLSLGGQRPRVLCLPMHIQHLIYSPTRGGTQLCEWILDNLPVGRTLEDTNAAFLIWWGRWSNFSKSHGRSERQH